MMYNQKKKIKRITTNKNRLFFYKALLVATTVEEVASVVSIPFLITCFQIIYIQIQKKQNRNQTTKRFLYIFTRWDIRHLRQSTDILVGASIDTPSRDNACMNTDNKTQKIKIKWCITRTRECLAGGRKRFSTSPKFLSTHMTCTCGYMLRGCIHLYCVQSRSSTPNISQSLVTQSHSGQALGVGRDLHYVLYNTIMLL